MRITIITAVRNAAGTIRDAMASVASQRLENGLSLEHIVVDGGSTDGTVEAVREFEEKTRGNKKEGESGARFVLRWISEPDRGLYDAINKGIRMATGNVIGICNADDVLAEDGTVVQIANAFDAGADLEGDVDAVYADVRFVRSVEKVDGMRKAPTVRYCTGKFFRNWMFRFATFPAHPSTFIRKECFDRYGLYSLDYSICADFELMLRLFYKNGIRSRYLPICTHVMRTGGVSTKNVRSNIRINSEDLRALRANGVWSCLPLVYLKYLAKVWGFIRRK